MKRFYAFTFLFFLCASIALPLDDNAFPCFAFGTEREAAHTSPGQDEPGYTASGANVVRSGFRISKPARGFSFTLHVRPRAFQYAEFVPNQVSRFASQQDLHQLQSVYRI